MVKLAPASLKMRRELSVLPHSSVHPPSSPGTDASEAEMSAMNYYSGITGEIGEKIKSGDVVEITTGRPGMLGRRVA